VSDLGHQLEVVVIQKLVELVRLDGFESRAVRKKNREKERERGKEREKEKE